MKEKITDILCSILDKPELKNVITDDTDILQELRLDSIGLINFFIRLEEAFDIELDTDSINIKDFRTINSIKNKLNQLIPSK